MHSGLTHRRYAWFLLGGLVASFAAIMAFNAVVDPYLVFGMPDWPGVVRNFSNQRLSKPYVVLRGEYDAVIVGSSRALRCNPDHPGFAGYRSYNLALAAGSIYESLRMLQHAEGAHHLRLAVVGLDYFAFSAAERVHPGFEEKRLTLDASGQRIPASKHVQDYATALASLGFLTASWAATEPWRHGDRSRHDSASRGDVAGNMAVLHALGGHRPAALLIEHQFLPVKGTWGVGRPDAAATVQQGLADFRTMLRFAHQHDIDLRLYLSPIHARLQAATGVVGIEPAWENWKRSLAALNEEVAAEYGQPPFRIWDFASINPYTVEEFPRDPQARMQWYEESSHFSQALGNRLLDVVLGRPEGVAWAGEGFGTPLQAGTIEDWLGQQREARRQWAQAHPDDMQDLVRVARNENPPAAGTATEGLDH